MYENSEMVGEGRTTDRRPPRIQSPSQASRVEDGTLESNILGGFEIPNRRSPLGLAVFAPLASGQPTVVGAGDPRSEPDDPVPTSVLTSAKSIE